MAPFYQSLSHEQMVAVCIKGRDKIFKSSIWIGKPGGELSGLPLSILGVVTLYMLVRWRVPGWEYREEHSSAMSSIP